MNNPSVWVPEPGCPHGHLPPCTQCQQEARVAELEKLEAVLFQFREWLGQRDAELTQMTLRRPDSEGAACRWEEIVNVRGKLRKLLEGKSRE